MCVINFLAGQACLALGTKADDANVKKELAVTALEDLPDALNGGLESSPDTIQHNSDVEGNDFEDCDVENWDSKEHLLFPVEQESPSKGDAVAIGYLTHLAKTSRDCISRPTSQQNMPEDSSSIIISAEASRKPQHIAQCHRYVPV